MLGGQTDSSGVDHPRGGAVSGVGPNAYDTSGRHAHRWVNLRRAKVGKQPRKPPGENPTRQPQPPTHTTCRRRVLGDTGTHGRRGTRRPLRRNVPNPPSRSAAAPTVGAPGRLGARTRRSIPNTCRNQDVTDPRRQLQQREPMYPDPDWRRHTRTDPQRSKEQFCVWVSRKEGWSDVFWGCWAVQ